MTKYFNYLQVTLLLALVSCGKGREMSFDEFNTLGDQDMWLSSEERVKPALYEDDYILGPKDSISVKIRDHEEFNTVTKVNLDGEIFLPLIEEPLLIEGLTIDQASETIGHFLAPYVRQGVMSKVELVTSGSRFYYLMGKGLNAFGGSGQGDVAGGNTSSSGSIRKVSMGEEPVYLRDLLLTHEDETNLENVTIIRPDFTDRMRPRFMTIDMSGIPHAIWNKNYRIRPNDIVVVKRNFREQLKDLVEIFTEEVDDLDQTDQRLEETLRFLEARLGNDTLKKERHSGGR